MSISKTLKIFPSILESDPKTVFDYISTNASLFNHYQIDIADGVLVEGKTCSVDDYSRFITQQPTLMFSDFSCEFHLMVKDFLPDIDTLTSLSKVITISMVIVHLEALLAQYPANNDWLQQLNNRSSVFKYGIAIQSNSSLRENIRSAIDFPVVQIMTIQPGGQGRPFEEKALQHINTLHEAHYSGMIQLDGGINDQTLPIVMSQKYIPDAVCPGSYLKENTQERLTKLQSILERKQNT